MTLGQHTPVTTTTGTTGTGLTGHQHLPGTTAAGTGASHGGGASKVTSTIKEKVAHIKADAVAAGQKITHPTNPATKQAATQEAQLKKAAATERKFEEQAVAGANEHGRVAGAHQGVAAKVNNLLPGHHAHTTTGTHNPTQPGIAAKVANVLPGHHAHTTTHNPTY